MLYQEGHKLNNIDDNRVTPNIVNGTYLNNNSSARRVLVAVEAAFLSH